MAFKRSGVRFPSAPPTVGLWRSLVARSLGVEEVAGSNPVSPTFGVAVSSEQWASELGRSRLTASWLTPHNFRRGVAQLGRAHGSGP